VQPQPGQQGQGAQVQGQARGGQVGQPAQWQNSDHFLATSIAIANQKEVTIAKLAEEKAKNKEVKEFANMLVKDHQNFLQKLSRYTPEATQEGFLNDREETTGADRRTSSSQREGQSNAQREGQSNAQRDAQPNAQRDGQNRVQPAGGEVKNANSQIRQTGGVQNAGAEAGRPLDMVQLQKEIAEECIRSSKRTMDKKDGAEFDECFVGFQIVAHAEMKDKLVVFQRHASGELGQIIADGISTTEKHLKRAEDLMKDIAHSDKSDSKRDRSTSSK